VKIINKSTIIFLFIALLFSCDTGTDADDLVMLEGTVFQYDSLSNVIPEEGVLITAQGLYKQTVSDIDGYYKIETEPSNDTLSVIIKASKLGFLESSASIEVAKGQSLQVPAIEMKKVTILDTTDTGGGDDPVTSGEAAHIEFITPHESHIYVYSSGLKETAVLGVKVTDAQGNLLHKSHAVQVNFNILHGPDGGEYLDPDTMTTDDGYAYTVLNSGTISGAIQIEAYVNLAGKTIQSIPSRIAIYGGLPDDDHFSVAVEKANIAGQVHFGLLDNITAFVGDKYSNPVAPGTIVYFSTDYGIVEGAAITDELGRASVRYMSAEPLPLDPVTSSFAKVSAWSYGDALAGLTLSAETTILLSSVTAPISILPASFQYDDLNEAKEFEYTISDIYGNPIIAGTDIKVEASDGKVIGDTQIELLDSRYPGNSTTDFGFVWSPGDSLEAPQVYISITVSSPTEGNGSRSLNIRGTKKIP